MLDAAYQSRHARGYGLGGSPMDMRTGGYVNATPEDAKHVAIVTALGQYYNVPCRSHGSLTIRFVSTIRPVWSRR